MFPAFFIKPAKKPTTLSVLSKPKIKSLLSEYYRPTFGDMLNNWRLACVYWCANLDTILTAKISKPRIFSIAMLCKDPYAFLEPFEMLEKRLMR